MSNLYESVTTSEGIAGLKEKIYGDFETNGLGDEERVNALTASTSMGFNSLFDILSKMTANSYMLNEILNDADKEQLPVELATVAQEIVELVKTIGESVSNAKVKSITDNLKVLMEKAEIANESTSDSESN